VPNADPVLDELVAGNDLDELVREVDRRTAAGDWDGLVRLRDRCRSALERGFQLWPASSLAEYRLALRAPAPWAAAVVTEGAGRFALGPLTEVVASLHTWSELAPYLAAAPVTALVAHERVVRGEDLAATTVEYADILDAPLALEPWEPPWPVPVYRDDDVDDPAPEMSAALRALHLPAAASRVPCPEVEGALRAVASHWVDHSNGAVACVSAQGDVAAVLAVLGLPTARADEVPAGDVLARLAWAGASGGARGRRRGAATGRDLAHGVVAALGGPARLAGLRWFAWDAGHPPTGWHCNIAIEDPASGTTTLLRAEDAIES